MALFSSGALSLSSLSSPVSFLAFSPIFFLGSAGSLTFFVYELFCWCLSGAESEGKAICFGDLVPADCVLHRLSEEFFALASLAISTWNLLKDCMASEGSSWYQVQSEEFPSGLFDRENGGNSTDETPSVSSSSKGDGFEKLWITRSYLSIVDEEGLKKIRDRYQIPDDVVLRILNPDERACSSKYDDVAFYEIDFNAGLRFPLQPFMRKLLDRLRLSPGQLAPNA